MRRKNREIGFRILVIGMLGIFASDFLHTYFHDPPDTWAPFPNEIWLVGAAVFILVAVFLAVQIIANAPQNAEARLGWVYWLDWEPLSTRARIGFACSAAAPFLIAGLGAAGMLDITPTVASAVAWFGIIMLFIAAFGPHS